MKMSVVFTVFAISTTAIAADSTVNLANYNSGIPTTEGITYTVPGAEGGPSVLYYTDSPNPGDFGIRLALDALGLGFTFAGDAGTYAGLLTAGGWDLVMQGHYNGGGDQPFEDGIAEYIAGGGQAVIHDWRFGETYDGVTFFSPTNYTSVTPIAGSRFAEHFGSTTPFSLGPWSTSWGVHNNSLVGGTGEPQLISNFGTTAGRIGDGGNTFIGGFIDDTIGPGFFDPALATDVYSAMILSIPEPTTFALLGLSALGVLRRRR